MEGREGHGRERTKGRGKGERKRQVICYQFSEFLLSEVSHSCCLSDRNVF